MNIAIVGATGNVGRKTLEVLEKKDLSIDNLYLLASSKSVGKKINFKGQFAFEFKVKEQFKIPEVLMREDVARTYVTKKKRGTIIKLRLKKMLKNFLMLSD